MKQVNLSKISTMWIFGFELAFTAYPFSRQSGVLCWYMSGFMTRIVLWASTEKYLLFCNPTIMNLHCRMEVCSFFRGFNYSSRAHACMQTWSCLVGSSLAQNANTKFPCSCMPARIRTCTPVLQNGAECDSYWSDWRVRMISLQRQKLEVRTHADLILSGRSQLDTKCKHRCPWLLHTHIRMSIKDT